jgi:hypothetical protein
MKKHYKQNNIVLHVWLLPPDDTCVALPLSFTLVSELTPTLSGAQNDLKICV